MSAANPFEFDVNRMMKDYKWPGLDPEMMTEGYKKNLEAVAAANKAAVEGMQAVVQRQMEQFRQSVEDFASVSQKVTEEEAGTAKAAAQTEAFKSAYEKTLANLRELADMMAKTNTEAFETLNKRFTEGLGELSQGLKKNEDAA